MALHPPVRHDDFCGISLCAGVGGLDLGLHIAESNYRTVCYVERNSFAAATLVARMADTSLGAAPIWDDLKSFDGRVWRGHVHIITAGYPCQPFTLSGLRKGKADPRHLWPDVARIVREITPEWVFFENVPGHLSLGFQDVARDLQEMGYRVAACVVSAAEVGASHTRERMFILGHADVQGQRESGLRDTGPRRYQVQNRSEPDRHTAGSTQPSAILDTSVPTPRCDGLDRRSLPVFAPEPSDLAQWRKALDRCPDLKPCLHRLDDGLAFGLDRSGAAGNGVVPLAAARAWAMLKAEFNSC